MAHITFGLFSDTQSAGEAVSELEQADYTDAEDEFDAQEVLIRHGAAEVTSLHDVK